MRVKAFERRGCHADDLSDIVKYLLDRGDLNISITQVEGLYREYSDSHWCAGWMNPTEGVLEGFATYLEEIEVEV